MTPKGSFVYYPGGFATGWSLSGVDLTDGRTLEINPKHLNPRRLDALEKVLGAKARKFLEALVALEGQAGKIRLSPDGFRVAIKNNQRWATMLGVVRKALFDIYGIEQIEYG